MIELSTAEYNLVNSHDYEIIWADLSPYHKKVAKGLAARKGAKIHPNGIVNITDPARRAWWKLHKQKEGL